MELTKEEFSLFNMKSKLKLLKKDGKLLRQRYPRGMLLVSLYSIYGFQIETIFDVDRFITISIKQVCNPDAYDMYPP